MPERFDPRIVAYFGDAILRAGFLPIPHLLLRHYAAVGLADHEFIFILLVISSAWDLRDPPKTRKDYARRMDVHPRSIQRYAKDIEGKGLIVIYDQFDERGAQVENGIDLSPLFAKLAQFAPEPAPLGTLRRRERRSKPEEDTGTGGETDLSPPSSGETILSPSQRSEDHSGRDHSISGRGDQRISPGEHAESPLNKELRNNKNHKKDVDDGSGYQGTDDSSLSPSVAVVGRSLRFGRALGPDDVSATHAVLQLIGIDNPVRSRIAVAYSPAEIWALWAYSLARSWSIGLTVVSVYDKERKKARLSEHLTEEYDRVGQLLADLPIPSAHTILQLVNKHCPSNPERLMQEPRIIQATAQDMQAVEAVWQMMSSVRGCSETLLQIPQTDPSMIAFGSVQENGVSVDIAGGPLRAYARVVSIWQQVLRSLGEQADSSRLSQVSRLELLAIAPDEGAVARAVVYMRITDRPINQGIEAAFASVLGVPVRLAYVPARKDVPEGGAGCVVLPWENADSETCEPVRISLTNFWKSVLLDLRAATPHTEFDTWLKEIGLAVLDLVERRVVVSVTNVFVREKVEGTYLHQIQDVIRRILGLPVMVQVEISYVAPHPVVILREDG